MSTTDKKPVIGISCGDLNGIGAEVIIKAFSDHRLLDFCTPIIFGSGKLFNFYKKTIAEQNFNYQQIRELNRITARQVNIFHCWEDEVDIKPGELSEEAGKFAIRSLTEAVQALQAGHIDGLVTAPIHKKNVQSDLFNFSGHTPYLKFAFNAPEVVMMMCSGDFRVAVHTEHVPLTEVGKFITKEALLLKIQVLNSSLIRDFGIDKPRIAVLGLNPHAGDEGLVGTEEQNIIRPALKEARNNNILAFGPYSADAFFARRQYASFDATLALYHDQGLIPFKSLAAEPGVNFSAGLPVVRTSPDHGVAFDIAGKDKADPSSFIAALFAAIDIVQQRARFDENHRNPLRKMTSVVLANAEDEKIEEGDEQ